MPWILIFLLVWLFVFRVLRGSAVKKDHPLLGRLWTLEADSNCFTLNDNVSRAERKWAAFQKCVENKDFFLLFTAPKLAVIVPKRIFDPASLNEFRNLAQTNIHPKTGGFPVIPLAQKAPESDAPKNM